MFNTAYTAPSVLTRGAIGIALAAAIAAVGFLAPSAAAQADGFLGYGSNVSGDVRTHAGEEWFFMGCSGDLVTVEMTSDELDSYIELYGPNSRRPIAEDDDAGGNGNALIEEFELTQSGVHAIVAAGATRNDRGAYSLTLDSDRDSAMAEETTLAYGDSVDGEVSTVRGEEWSFWGCSGDVISLLMASDEFAGYLELYGPTGRRPLMEADAAQDGTVEIGEFVLPESGIYTVFAAGNSRRDRGAYTLTLSASAAEDAGSSSVASSTIAQSTPAPTPTSRPTATAVAPTSTPIVRSPTATPTAIAPPTAVAPSVPGLVTDFESWGNWRRGDEAWGTFTQSGQQPHGGRYVGRFEYAFPANEPKNYLVYQQSLPIPGTPTALTLWVYGDGSGNFLNAWVTDANQETWQFTFGRVYHTGWRQMRAPLDLSLGWPNQAVGSSSASAVAYPIRLAALVLDGAEEDKAYDGTILVDDLIATTAAPSPSQAQRSPVAATPQAVEEPAAPAINVDHLPPPVAIGYDFPYFKWEWAGMPAMSSVDDWYFDVKIFNDEYSEYPYDVKVAEVGSVAADGPNLWRFDKRTDFRCGSFWAVQIAKANPDGSYVGPLSPESNRVPTGRGCDAGTQSSGSDGQVDENQGDGKCPDSGGC